MVQEYKVRNAQEQLAVTLRDPKVRYSLIAAGIIFLGAAGYYGWRWHRLNGLQQAQRDFAESLDLYKQAQRKPSLWSEVEEVFQTGLNRNAGTKLEPFFMWYQAQSLKEQGFNEKALELMHQALSLMSSDASLLPLLRTAYAVALIDGGKVEQGLADLEQLAYDTHNTVRDMALFYLGEQYKGRGQSDKAQQVWNDLLTAFPVAQKKGFNHDYNASPWSSLVPEEVRALRKQ